MASRTFVCRQNLRYNYYRKTDYFSRWYGPILVSEIIIHKYAFLQCCVVEKVQRNVQQYLNKMTVDKRVRTLFWQSSKMCCVTLFVLSWRCGLNSSSDGAVRVSCFSTAAYTLYTTTACMRESDRGKSWLSVVWWNYCCTFHWTFSKTPYWRRVYKLIIITETNIGSYHLLKQSGKTRKEIEII